ncbi:MAG: histone deacetylase [Bacteroidetes bacterium B1(2017)]|nr:MAG: histone deacetylase [Bacteroidetes bacterium B1(2017)]
MFKIAYSPIYQHPLPDGHRFPMLKYDLIPRQLVYQGIAKEQDFFEPSATKKDDILLTHDENYYNQLLSQTLDASHIRRIGFPMSPQLIERELILVQGTIDCAYHALTDGVSMNVAGGTHHAFANKGEGFCLFNDMAVAANVLLKNKSAQRILIIDLDVHQGNGTASIFKDEPRVFTFSMHGGDNYPFHKEHSDLDIPLKNGTEDNEYLLLLEKNLEIIFQKHQPDFIFYLCGVDVLESDKLGKLKMSEKGCKKRDELVFSYCKQQKSPVACAMGGGYSPKIGDIVNAHCQTFEAAQHFFL